MIDWSRGFSELRPHVGHEIACVIYGQENVALECETCNIVLIDFFADEDEDRGE